jgi:hypothetical protein
LAFADIYKCIGNDGAVKYIPENLNGLDCNKFEPSQLASDAKTGSAEIHPSGTLQKFPLEILSPSFKRLLGFPEEKKETLQIPVQPINEQQTDLLSDAQNAYRKGHYANAAILFGVLAEQENLIAQTALGLMYLQGQGVSQDDVEAAKWFKLAAAQGLKEAQSILGLMYHQGQGVSQDDVEAVRWFQLAAAQGDAVAQTNLGASYYGGRGAIQDYRAAVKWFQLAAEQGLKEAQDKLGSIYFTGQGVLQNYKEAAKWFQLAAEQGDGSSQAKLGIMYSGGLGVPHDNIRGYMWVNLASANAIDSTTQKYFIEARDSIAKNMTVNQIIEAQELARKCAAKQLKGC